MNPNTQGIANLVTTGGDVVMLGGVPFRRKPRWYTLTITRTAVVGANFPGQIQIDPNLAPFLLTSLHAADTADGTALTSQENWLVQASDNENGYLWADNFVERSSMFGSREFGFNLPDVCAIRANTRISYTVQNRAAGAVAGTAIICLKGWQLIPM